MIDTPEDRADVRPIRAERPADTLIEKQAPRPVTVIAVVPVDDIYAALRHIVFQAVCTAIAVIAIGAVIGLSSWREYDR